MDGVEGCAEVKEDEDGDVASVGGAEDVVCNFEESGFGAVS